MTIPAYLAVAQWALLLALGMLVIIMYRQLGHVFAKKDGARFGPAVGSRAAEFEYASVSSGSKQYFSPGAGSPALIAFVDPTCPSCEQLVAALNEAEQGGELADVRVLLLTGDPPSYLQISDAFRATRLEIGRVTTPATLEEYQASATPLLVAIDSAGVVQAAGPAMLPADVRSYRQACLLSPHNAVLTVTLASAGTTSEEPTASSPEPR